MQRHNHACQRSNSGGGSSQQPAAAQQRCTATNRTTEETTAGGGSSPVHSDARCTACYARHNALPDAAPLWPADECRSLRDGGLLQQAVEPQAPNAYFVSILMVTHDLAAPPPPWSASARWPGPGSSWGSAQPVCALHQPHGGRGGIAHERLRHHRGGRGAAGRLAAGCWPALAVKTSLLLPASTFLFADL
jgi:hypothetical protein